MRNPFISIILPTYNRADLIGETIESICHQSYSNWELLVVDDGSDDNTEDLVNAFGDERIRFYKVGRTGNIIRLRMIGMTMTSGELIAFMDSDDLWPSEKLQKQVDAFLHFPDAGFSLTGGYNFRIQQQPEAFFYRQREGMKYGNVLRSFFKSEVAMIFPSLIFRRTCLQKLKEAGLFPFHSDVDFLIALAVHFSAVVLYEPLLYRRLHETNNSNDDWEKGYTDKIVVIQSSQKNKLIPASLAKEALFKLYINFGENYLRLRQQRNAIRKFWKAWESRPYSIVPFKKTGKAVLSLLRSK